MKRFPVPSLAGFSFLLFFFSPLALGHEYVLKKSTADSAGALQFSCTDTIHLVVDWVDIKKGPHSVEAEWLNPQGEKQDITQAAFKDAETTSVLWLKLHPAASLLRTVSSVSGYEGFVGNWKVKIYLDGRWIKTLEFAVEC